MENYSIDKLDATDLIILRTIQQNSHLTNKEIAKEAKLSVTPTFERVKRLERDGYIKKYITVLDAEKLNRGFVVYCSVKLSPLNSEIAKEFCDMIQDIKEVTECYNISGKFDYLLKVHAPDMRYYQQFVLNVLGKFEHLGSIESTFVMEEVKLQYGVSI